MSGIEIMMHYLLTYQARQLDVSSGDAALAATITSIVALALVPSSACSPTGSDVGPS